MSPSTVSVIIPTYNRAAFLERALRSVLSQARADDEVIVVDDGSDDETPHILRSFGERIRTVPSDHGGAGKARNLGIAQARNDLVAFLDSDDEWLPGKLDLQRAFMDSRPDVLYCFTNFQVAEKHGAIHHRYLDGWSREHASWEEALGSGVPFSSLAPIPAGIEDFQVFLGDLYRWQLTGYYALTDTIMVRRREAGDALHFAEDLPTYEDLACFSSLSRQGRAAFLDVETARQTNYAGDRLSELDILPKLDARLAIVERLWGSDPAFLREHEVLYRRVRRELLLRKVKRLLLEGRPRQARAALKRMHHAPWTLRVMSGLPRSVSMVALRLRRALA
ncbi:glycosyltransferase family 2 protein [Haliangium sp.]|uniref:glycosyltransferase family 2 protein n=1 Tax=Haliangium sp. TaxID=2663208 RepID=UPI003D117FC8